MSIRSIMSEIQRRTRENQSKLAKRFGVAQPTVSRWMSGSEPEFEHREKILKVARSLGVIVLSEEAAEGTVEIIGYVGAGGQVLFEEGQGPFGEAAMPPKGATKRTVAVTVRGDSMAGQLEDGWTVYYDNRQAPPAENLLGRLCVVGLDDGRVLIKRLIRRTADGRYDLYSVNAPPLLDQRVEWAAPVTWIHPR